MLPLSWRFLASPAQALPARDRGSPSHPEIQIRPGTEALEFLNPEPTKFSVYW